MADQVDRRTVLCQGCAWAVAGLSGCVVGGVGGGVNDGAAEGVAVDSGVDSGLRTATTTTGLDAACAVEASTAGGWVELSFADHPELDAVGGWVQVNVGGRSLNVAQIEADCFVAMETSCTHQGARVDYRPERGQFVCTLHGAVYVANGEPIAGPTSVALATYPVARSGSSVWVEVG